MSTENDSLVAQIAELIEQKFAELAAEQPVEGQILYRPRQAAKVVGVSVSFLEILIARGEICVRYWGSEVLVPREELERVAKKDFPELLPPKEC